MAVDSILYPEADHLAHAQKAFYPVRIPVSHWQLRHYISTPEPDLLYYASGHDIYCLNTSSRKRKHIATLPFEARCTASGYGWVCVGGEEMGHFAAIKLDGSGPRSMDVDSALPIENWRPQDDGRRAASVRVERMGEDIVNSISIHRIQDEDAHLDDIVAVLTNNDKTVRMYSLPANHETMVLDLPFPMNHATVSPDGQTLIAVGDYNQAYFFQREIQDTPPQIHKPHNRLNSSSIEWTVTSIVTLHVTEPGATTGYFTTAWSPNGRLVAVGSEGGYITVIDIDLFGQNPDVDDQDAIIAVAPGSRPDFTNPHPGAIRSMMFSPEPWDLLIWAEDQGRICIGDLRTGLRSRQIVNLEVKEDSLRRIAFEDLPRDEEATAIGVSPRLIDDLEADLERRVRQASDNNSQANFATEYIEEARRQRQLRQEMAGSRWQASSLSARERALLDDDPQGLTAREQQILESLRTIRQREEARSHGGLPRSVNYTSSDMFRESGSTTSSANTPNTTTGTSSARPISEILSSVQDTLPELSRSSAVGPRPGSSYGSAGQGQNALPPLSALQDGTWGPAAQRAPSNLVRLSDGSRLPRRRASVVLTPPSTNSSTTNTGTTSRADASAMAEISELARLQREMASSVGAGGRQPTVAAVEEENPWRTIENEMTLARGPLFESAQRAQAASPLPASREPTRAELMSDIQSERDRQRALLRQRERRQYLSAANSSNQPSGRTGGVASTAETSRLPTLTQQGNEILLRRSAALRGAYSGRELGVRTAGLAMSPDGRTLWAACEEGIFEIGIKIKGRFFWPAVEPR